MIMTVIGEFDNAGLLSWVDALDDGGVHLLKALSITLIYHDQTNLAVFAPGRQAFVSYFPLMARQVNVIAPSGAYLGRSIHRLGGGGGGGRLP